MKLVALYGAVLALCLASGACAGQAETKPPEQAALRMSATTARDLQPAFSRLAHLGVNVVTEGGSSVIGLQNLQSGRIDLAMAMADVAYLAYAGQLDSSPPFDRLRGMAVVSLNTLHLLVARDAPIRAITDLEGRRIALGPRGSATALIAGLVLDAYGIPVQSVNSYELSYVETAETRLS
jgi:TRAP transporter TAXI family solute receptor